MTDSINPKHNEYSGFLGKSNPADLKEKQKLLDYFFLNLIYTIGKVKL